MHEIGTQVIEIQIAEIPMKSLSFLNRSHAVCSFCKYLCELFTQAWSGPVLVSRRPTLNRGSGETVYKKFGAAGMLEAPIRSLHFKLIM